MAWTTTHLGLKQWCIRPFSQYAGYQGPRVAEVARARVEIVRRTDAGFVVQPKCWVVERTFAWACINRRLARDVERAIATAQAFFQIAMIKLMARRIARYWDFKSL